jgi:hypothetical protein
MLYIFIVQTPNRLRIEGEHPAASSQRDTAQTPYSSSSSSSSSSDDTTMASSLLLISVPLRDTARRGRGDLGLTAERGFLNCRPAAVSVAARLRVRGFGETERRGEEEPDVSEPGSVWASSTPSGAKPCYTTLARRRSACTRCLPSGEPDRASPQGPCRLCQCLLPATTSARPLRACA